MILSDYIFWHYGLELRERLNKSKSLLETVANFFSILPLLKTLLAPWHRVIDPYQRGFELGAFFWTLSSNLISRILGAITRSILIAVGLLALALVLFWRVLAVALWLLEPILLPLTILVGALFILAP